jgi:hypothetical protein
MTLAPLVYELIAREPAASRPVAGRPPQLAWTLAPLVDPRSRSFEASLSGVVW